MSTQSSVSADVSDRRPQADINLLDARLLQVLYGAVGQPDGWAVFLDAFTRTYDGGKGLFGLHDVALHGGLAQAGSQWEPAQFAAYNDQYVRLNPWIPSLGRRPVGLAVPAEFMLPHADLVRTPFYHDFLRHCDLDSGVGVTVQQSGTRHLIVSVLFPHRTAERDPDSVGRLQRMVPHLLRVAQLNRQLGTLEARATASEAALDRLGTAMLIVNAARRVVYLNAAADAIVAAGDGLRLVRRELMTTSAGETAHLHRLLAGALAVGSDAAAPPGGTMRIGRKSGRAAYEVLVAPVTGVRLPLDLAGVLAAVFVRDPERQSVPPAELLRQMYSMTGAEARVLQALLSGNKPKDIADRFAVSHETIRSQLKSIFAKSGASSQADLIRRSLSGIAALAGRHS